MHIVIAPNAFKGSLTAEEAANCIAEGIRQSRLSCELTLMPVADGGDGTAHLIAQKMKGESVKVMVHDPLGRKVEATFGWLVNEQTAIIEMSDASGLRLLKTDELNPLSANTGGTGELIKAALDKGAKKLIIGLGGSATVDGAAGLFSELGVRFLDGNEKEITEFPMGLLQLKSIEAGSMDQRLQSSEIVVMCDVKNTLLGNNGAASVFGQQKGANENERKLLEKCLEKLNEVTKQVLKVDMSSLIYGGAAGGVAAGLVAFANARLVSGIEYFLEVVHFDQALKHADLVITAEGSLDMQTLEGKGPYGVAKKTKEKKIPVIALAGQIPLEINKEMSHYFDVILAVGHAPSSIPEAIQNTSADLKRTSCELANLLALKQK